MLKYILTCTQTQDNNDVTNLWTLHRTPASRAARRFRNALSVGSARDVIARIATVIIITVKQDSDSAFDTETTRLDVQEAPVHVRLSVAATHRFELERARLVTSTDRLTSVVQLTHLWNGAVEIETWVLKM